MILTTKIGEFEMEQIVLDIGSYVNVLTKKRWEAMGRPALQWSPVQLRMANQVKVVPLGRLPKVLIDLDGVKSTAEFEVIEIIDNKSPYPTLLGIEWALDCNGIINLKRKQMTFDDGTNRITTLIDPAEGPRYVKHVRDERELDTIYNIMANHVDYVEPNEEEKLSWENMISWDGDSEQALEDWQNHMHEVSTIRCAYITKSLRWIGTEVCNVLSFDASNDLEEFMFAYQVTVQDQDQLRALDVALKATLARWWATHKDHIENWSQFRTLITARFYSTMMFEGVKYAGDTSLVDHVNLCIEEWRKIPQMEWVHRFVSTLDIIPRNWYIKLEL